MISATEEIVDHALTFLLMNCHVNAGLKLLFHQYSAELNLQRVKILVLETMNVLIQ